MFGMKKNIKCFFGIDINTVYSNTKHFLISNLYSAESSCVERRTFLLQACGYGVPHWDPRGCLLRF